MDNPKRDTPAARAFVVSESRGISQDVTSRQPWSHFVQVTEGAAIVTTPTGRYLAPPQHAIFIPAGTPHAVASRRECTLLRLFVEPSRVRCRETQVFATDRLVEQLSLAAVAVGGSYPDEGREARLIQVLLDRIALLESRPFFLPAAQSPAFANITARLVGNPCARVSLETWSADTGMSSKTAARRFEAETGMTFGKWRQRLRMLHALERLSDGESVALVAVELGHTDLSAFGAAFKKTLGQTPARYLARARE